MVKMKTARDYIGKIVVDRSNIEHIAKTSVINGSLLIDLERVMKEYALEACKETLKNSNFRFEKHYYLDNVDMPFEKHKIRELITDEENIPKEVKS